MTTLRIENVLVEKSYAYTFDSKRVKDVVFKETSDDGVLLFTPKRATLLNKIIRPYEAPCIEELTFNRDYRRLEDLKVELNYFNHITENCFQKYSFQKGKKFPYVPFHGVHSTSPYRYYIMDILEEHNKDSLYFTVDFEVSMKEFTKNRTAPDTFMAGTIQILAGVK